ncbi:MAG TPA: hypothetical protein VFW14_10905 [Gaiellales bacterium]|nr:hypothetical protein [Gaiellales bacterium]
MNTHQPRKRRSALAALPLAIAVEIGAILVDVGGAVSAAAAFLVVFGVCHQIRLMRWRRQQPA